MAGAQPFIRFDGVVKRYGTSVVLDNLHLGIHEGEKLSLIGPSGSGKTTILRILMTLEKIEGGHVWIEDKPLWHMPKQGQLVPADERHLALMRAQIGMVFQHFNLFPHMTARENISRPQRIVKGTDKAVADKIAMELLDRVGLAAKADNYPSMLSGGQKQRVAIARALAMQPRIMLFDEVTSALDPEVVDEVLQVLRNISRESRMTMLMVTHEMSFAREFSDRVLFLDGGKIVEQGPPDQLFHAPREPRTKSFLKKIAAAGHRVD
ncbi:ectoine/hydroxyectoine ABC transporter ATP-binding protein EhuA [Variovorax sp. GB1R11]|uniref:ectoine/hydroxyectoine ABC transporter ATP-binding protein EhuA n=1 Tax=Variovorax sp. GB1R11 TaxID=3443741 RepID=UPI003F46AF86